MKLTACSLVRPDQLINLIILQGRHTRSERLRRSYKHTLSAGCLSLSFGPGRGQGNNSTYPKGRAIRHVCFARQRHFCTRHDFEGGR
jgi:hypothetical protein